MTPEQQLHHKLELLALVERRKFKSALGRVFRTSLINKLVAEIAILRSRHRQRTCN